MMSTFTFLFKRAISVALVVVLLLSMTVVLAETNKPESWQAKRIYEWLSTYKLGEKDSIEFFTHNGYNMAIMVQHQFEGIEFPPREPKLKDAQSISSEALAWAKENPDNLAKMEEVLRVYGTDQLIEYSPAYAEENFEVEISEELLAWAKESPENQANLELILKQLEEEKEAWLESPLDPDPYERLIFYGYESYDFDTEVEATVIPLKTDQPNFLDNLKKIVTKESKNPVRFWNEWNTVFYLVDRKNSSVVLVMAHFDKNGVVSTLFVDMNRKEHKLGDSVTTYLVTEKIKPATNDMSAKEILLNEVDCIGVIYNIPELGCFYYNESYIKGFEQGTKPH